MSFRIDGPQGGPLRPDGEVNRLIDTKKLKEEQEAERANELMQLFAFDKFERLLADARQYSSEGKSAEAQGKLDEAFQYAKTARDDGLEDELVRRIHMVQQQQRI